MSDTTDSLQLPGARLEKIETGKNEITLYLSGVNIVRAMEGAYEDTLWVQDCKLIIRDIEIEGELPDFPCEIKGGDLVNNIFTYRDHAPLPIDWRGSVGCNFTVADSGAVFSIEGESLQLERIDNPRYIRHIKKT
ncbi:MAG: hypothetical protein HKM88_07065 [Halobacteria archaeon]|nr:hypothetical protein [Halobacteria archaeon]